MNAFRVKVPRRERSTTRFPVSRALLFVRAVAKRRQQYMQARPLSAETSVIRSSGTVMTVEGNMRLDRFGEDRRDPRRRRTIAFMQARHRDLGGLHTMLQRKGASCDTSGLPSTSNGGAACLGGHVRICAGQPAFLPQFLA